MDYYKTLDIEKSATQDEVKKAFRKLSLIHHPDRGGDENEFKKLSEAYETLGDPDKRKHYDMFGNNSGPQFNPFTNNHFDNIMNDFFGHHQPSQRQNIISENIDLNIQLTLEELYTGTSKKIEFTRKTLCSTCNGLGHQSTVCPNCQGSGQIVRRNGPMLMSSPCNTCRGSGRIGDKDKPCLDCERKGYTSVFETQNIKIPPGAGSLQTNVTLNINGYGNQIGNRRGAVRLSIQIIADPKFSQENSNLIYFQDIVPTDLYLGNKFIVVLPDKQELIVTLHPGIDIQQMHRIKQKGFCNPHNPDQRGDLLIKYNLIINKTVTPEQKEILKLLRDIGL